MTAMIGEEMSAGADGHSARLPAKHQLRVFSWFHPMEPRFSGWNHPVVPSPENGTIFPENGSILENMEPFPGRWFHPENACAR
jgi:hypothetical protein